MEAEPVRGAVAPEIPVAGALGEVAQGALPAEGVREFVTLAEAAAREAEDPDARVRFEAACRQSAAEGADEGDQRRHQEDNEH